MEVADADERFPRQATFNLASHEELEFIAVLPADVVYGREGGTEFTLGEHQLQAFVSLNEYKLLSVTSHVPEKAEIHNIDAPIHDGDSMDLLCNTIAESSASTLPQQASAMISSTNVENLPQSKQNWPPSNFIQAKVIHIVPSGHFLQQQDEGTMCPSCRCHLTRRQNLDDHLLRHLEDSPYSEVIISEEEYEYVHPKKVKINSAVKCAHHFYLKFNCPEEECRYAIYKRLHFEKLKFLKQHFLKMHAEKIFTCGRCCIRFSTISLRDAHQRTCGILFQCNNCKKAYKDFSTLQTHARRSGHSIDEEKYKKMIETIKENSRSKNAEASASTGSIYQIQTNDGTTVEIYLPPEFPALSSDFFHAENNINTETEKMNKEVSPTFQSRDKNNNAESDGIEISLTKEITTIDLTFEEGEDNRHTIGAQNQNDELPLLGTQDVPQAGSGREINGVRQGNRARKIASTSKQRPAFPDLVKILPKPTIHAATTDSEAQTDATSKPCASTALKRRHSAATQTKPSRVSIDTQTPNKRPRLKSSNSAETQTMNSSDLVNLDCLPVQSRSGAERSNSAQAQPTESSSVEGTTGSTGVEVQSYDQPIGGNEEFCLTGWVQLLPLTDTQQSNQHEIPVPASSNNQKVRDSDSGIVLLSSVLLTDMSTSPMHFPEELCLFPDLLGAETQTDFTEEMENTGALDCRSSETQTYECPPEQQQQSDPSFDVLDFSFEFFDDPETIDGETQTH